MRYLVLLSIFCACSKTTPPPPKGSDGSDVGAPMPNTAKPPAPPPAVPADPAVSNDILARPSPEPMTYVKHILFAWKDLAAGYPQNSMDPRAANRTQAEAAQLAKDVAAKLVADPTKIDALVTQYSEDPGGAGDPYEVTPDNRLVPEFKALALRLKMGEVGIVRTMFGYHVMIRVAAPPLDPLESADILARPQNPATCDVQNVLIGWKDTPAAKVGRASPEALKRTKAEADKIAKDVLAKARAGADFTKLMSDYSEDPGSAKTGHAYAVDPDAPLSDKFKKLSLRLHDNEVGLVKSEFGWHIIKRLTPTPPDPLDSVDILKRLTITDKSVVKHILLCWKDLPCTDPRGKKRTREELDALVKDTVAKLKAGAPIEPLMKELSEDPGSAATGESYPVTPDAGMVPPFTALSLRLSKGEVGVVKTQFGIHIIKRIE
ncbi:MAG TPA: peptidylprolyl isomerase [Kofleriaceae bacterium]|jgi:parvulin-like peptidyl-prolyl isomerase